MGKEPRRPKKPARAAGRNGSPATRAANRSRPNGPIVAMGASAGGLEAFEQFFRHMPPDSGMAFVLVPHLDAHHKSALTELVGRYTKMPVVEIADRMEVRPNHVHVIPPNATLTIEG